MKLDKIKFSHPMNIKNQKDKIPNQGTILFTGKTNSGKSTQVLDVLMKKQHIFSYAYVISETECVNKTFSNHIPKNLIDNSYSESRLNQIFEFQKKVWVDSKETARMVIVMDDCMSDKKFLSHVLIRKLFQQARHYGILFLLCTQYFMDIPKGLRSNVEFVSFGSENNIETRKTLYKTFFGFFTSFREFDSTYKKYTSDYSVIFIKPASKSYVIKDNMYYYKSNSFNRQGEYKHEFRIGSPEIWAKCKEKRGKKIYSRIN